MFYEGLDYLIYLFHKCLGLNQLQVSAGIDTSKDLAKWVKNHFEKQVTFMISELKLALCIHFWTILYFQEQYDINR